MAGDEDTFLIKIEADATQAARAFDETSTGVQALARGSEEQLTKLAAALQQATQAARSLARGMGPDARADREEAESFLEKIQSFATKAGESFETLSGRIQTVTSEGNEKFGVFAAAIGGTGTAALAAIANFTPLGRAVSAVIEALQKAAGVVRQLAETMGVEGEFERFESRLSSLAGVAGQVLVHGMGEASNAVLAFMGVIPDAGEEGRLQRFINGMSDGLRELEEMTRRRFGIPVQEPEVSPFSVSDEEVERMIAALERQNLELEITVATTGMAADAAARYAVNQRLAAVAVENTSNEHLQLLARLNAVREALAANRLREAELREEQRLRRQEEARARQVERILGGAEGRVRQMELQARAVGMTAEETARLVTEERILQQLRMAGAPIDAAMLERVREQAARLAAANERMAEAKRRMNEIEAAGRIMGGTLERAFGDWISGTETDWKRLFNALIRDLATLALRTHVLQPLFGGGGTQGGGLFGSLISSLLPIGPWTTTTIPARQHGGPVSAGMPYMVGEGGPELFIPGADGAIAASAGRPAGTNVVINNYANAEVEASAPDDGQLEITVRAIARDEFASERMNPIMRGKHGINPRLRAR